MKNNSIKERQDVTCSEERTELSPSSCSPRDIPDGYRLSHANFEEDRNVCEFLWNATGDEGLLEKII